MAQQKSEDRVLLEGGVMPAEPAGSSAGGQGKAIPVDQAAWQLGLPIATAEDPRGSARVVASNLSGTGQAGVPEAIVNAEKVMPVTMDEVVYRLSDALVKVVSNKGAPGPDGQTVEQLAEQWPTVGPRLAVRLLDGSYRPGAVRRAMIPKAGGGERGLGIPTVTVYRKVTQRVFGFAGCDASVSPVGRRASSGVVRASLGGLAFVCVRGWTVGQCDVARGSDRSSRGAGCCAFDGRGPGRIGCCGRRDRGVLGGAEGSLMLCANLAQEYGRVESQRAERRSAAGALPAFGAVCRRSAGDAAGDVAASGAPLRAGGVSLRAGRAAWPVSVPGCLWRREWPFDLRAGGSGGHGRCSGRDDCAPRRGAGGDLADQPGAVAPAGARVMSGRVDGRRGASRAGQHARGGAGGGRGW